MRVFIPIKDKCPDFDELSEKVGTRIAITITERWQKFNDQYKGLVIIVEDNKMTLMEKESAFIYSRRR